MYEFTYEIDEQIKVFSNAYAFTFDLFESEYKTKKEVDHYELLRSYLEYYRIEKDEIELIKDVIRVHVQDWKQWDDVEYTTLILMQKLKKQEILLLINQQPIIDFTEQISIDKNTLIQFIDLKQIDSINFKK